MGIRKVGSSLSRWIDIQGGVSVGSYQTYSAWVMSDASGNIELYAELTTAADAWMQGSFDSGTYTEVGATVYNQTGTGWEDKDVSADVGTAAVIVDWAVGTDNGGDVQGVRVNGSSIERLPATTTAAVGVGWRGVTCMVNSDVNGVIETYTDNLLDDAYHCMGYFS